MQLWIITSGYSFTDRLFCSKDEECDDQSRCKVPNHIENGTEREFQTEFQIESLGAGIKNYANANDERWIIAPNN